MEVRFGHLWRIWGASGAGQDYSRARLKGSGLSGIMIKTPIPFILLWYILLRKETRTNKPPTLSIERSPEEGIGEAYSL
ncbi:hypothetical protein ARMGADRAFT_1057148 [Armillaria gallica]|uniref:Uncharacterized protein n=1 Tax=Armillaria gallica TaxID=47427 RepID=A0A2H3EMH8_ARMGA|nr:hypothetical protein ARMGADRAFT_1057148 [Armillaria gallica]